MKAFTMISVAVLASLAMAAQASAASFAPPNTSFTGAGTTNLKKGIFPPIPCTANFTGHTDAAGAAFIDTAAFTGSVACTSIAASGLSWGTTITGPNSATINGVAFSSPLGPCGPANLPVNVSSTGVITFNYTITAGNCTVSTTGGGIVTTPAVTIVWP